jgi:hypothetical protein
VQARDPALLSELLVPGREPGEGEDEPTESNSAEPSTGSDDKCHHDEPETRAA